MVKSPNLCVVCKGSKHLCGHNPCPLLARFRVMPEVKKSFKEDFFGPSPSVFVGRSGYPNVSVGPFASLQDKPEEDPSDWFGEGYSNIIRKKSLNLRSKYNEKVKSNSRLVRMLQELSMASKPADVELKFKNKPKYKVSFSNVTQPEGPVADLRKAELAENVKVRRHVDKIVSDDLKTVNSAEKLYNKGEDVYKISTIFSSGALGMEDSKKLVPTRWSITAIDDIIAKNLLEEVRDFSSINKHLVFKANYLGNKFVILLSPGKWEYENFEAWHPGSTWYQGGKEPFIVEEYEPFQGRTKYAKKQAGGYYAARLAVIEALHDMKRQARVVAFREVTSKYTIPLGVWVVRETARNAFKKSPRKFENRDLAMSYIKNQLKNPIENYKAKSNILGQRRLNEF